MTSRRPAHCIVRIGIRAMTQKNDQYPASTSTVVDTLDFVPGDQDLLDQGNPVMDAIRRKCE